MLVVAVPGCHALERAGAAAIARLDRHDPSEILDTAPTARRRPAFDAVTPFVQGRPRRNHQ
jgi:hypothetical protein